VQVPECGQPGWRQGAINHRMLTRTEPRSSASALASGTPTAPAAHAHHIVGPVQFGGRPNDEQPEGGDQGEAA